MAEKHTVKNRRPGSAFSHHQREAFARWMGLILSLVITKPWWSLGESGCGKSSLAKAILRLLPKERAEILRQGVSQRHRYHAVFSDEEFRKNVRWKMMSMVPQAAMNSLNPVLKIGDQVTEPFMIHTGATQKRCR